MKFEDYQNSAIVKSMLAMGFTEEYIMKNIESGDIKIEKSEDVVGKHESETKQEKGIDKLEKEAVEKEEKVKEDEKKTAEDFKKSVEESFIKSMAPITSVMEKMSETLNLMNDKLDRMGKQAPDFKSSGLENFSAIKKSIDLKRGEDDKYELNIVSQRPIVLKAIEKAYDQMPEELQKSLQSDMLAYMTNPEAETVGQELAQYMYDKCGIKLSK